MRKIPDVACRTPMGIFGFLQRSTLLLDSVSTTSTLLLFRVPTLHVATLNLVGCLLDLLQWPDPASRTRESAKPKALPTCLRLPAPPYLVSDERLAIVSCDEGFSGTACPSCRPNLEFVVSMKPPFLPSGCVPRRCPPYG